MKHFAIILPLLIIYGCNTTNHDENLAIVKQYVDAVENLNFGDMDGLLSTDYRGFGPSAHNSINKEEALENWKENSENLYDKIEFIREHYAGFNISEGENKGNWVAHWSELKITYKDDTGSVSIWANTNYKVENGKIVKSYTFYNEADVLQQLEYVFIHQN